MAGPGRAVKREQEEISPSHVRVFSGASVLHVAKGFYLVKDISRSIINAKINDWSCSSVEFLPCVFDDQQQIWNMELFPTLILEDPTSNCALMHWRSLENDSILYAAIKASMNFIPLSLDMTIRGAGRGRALPTCCFPTGPMAQFRPREWPSNRVLWRNSTENWSGTYQRIMDSFRRIGTSRVFAISAGII